MSWLVEAVAQQDQLNQIRQMRLDAEWWLFQAHFAGIFEWLDAVETAPYDRED